MSKSRSHISNTLRLLSLPKDVIGLIEEGNLTAGQARPLIGLPSATNIAEEIDDFVISSAVLRSKSQYRLFYNVDSTNNITAKGFIGTLTREGFQYSQTEGIKATSITSEFAWPAAAT